MHTFHLEVLKLLGLQSSPGIKSKRTHIQDSGIDDINDAIVYCKYSLLGAPCQLLDSIYDNHLK